MLIKEALENLEIKYLRLPEWNKTSCLELPVVVDGCRGPWFHLIDIGKRLPICFYELLNDKNDKYEICEGKPFEKTIHHVDEFFE